MNKKVLIISFYYPPRKGVAGNRISGLTKYLPKYGWTPVLLTAKLPAPSDQNIEIIESDYSDKIFKIKSFLGYNHDRSFYDENPILRSTVKTNKTTFINRFLYSLQWLLLFPDRYAGWAKSAIKDADNYLISNHVDIIFSSSGPIISHVIASQISKKYNIPWVADYRDLWSQSHYLEIIRLLKNIAEIYEKKLLKNAIHITSVTQKYTNQLSQLHKKPGAVIVNGYDEEEVKPVAPETIFSFIYTGQLYMGKRDPELLFNTLLELTRDNFIDRKLIKVKFYGSKDNWTQRLIEKYNLQDLVYQMGVVQRDEIIKIQRKGQFLLLLNWDNPDDEGNIPAKLFEYFAAQRPIISLGTTKGIVYDIINKTKTGIATNDLNELKRFIRNNYEQFIMNNAVPYEPDFKELTYYSQNNMAKKFSDLFSATNFKYNN
jgi:glycosyltransferase involved in cell wall biosynthesis